MKAIDGGAFADHTWVCLAMTYDGGRGLVDAWLDGVRTPCRFRDAVAAAVFGDEAAHDVNPAPFPQPIFAPRAFLLKCGSSSRQVG
jgi:hypothetical protein